MATHQFPRLPHIFCTFCPVLSLLLLWTVLLGCHQDLWLCDLLSDGSHEQPLNEMVEALSPNIRVQFHSLPHRGTSLHNTLSTCLRFVQLQSNFRKLLTGYIAGMAETFESLIWLSERPVWNFLWRLLLLIPHTCLPAAAVYPLRVFSVPLPSVLDIGSYFCLLKFCFCLFPDYGISVIRYPFVFLLRLDGSNRFSGHFQQDCLGTFPEILWVYLIMCSLQCHKPVGHLCCKLYCFLFLNLCSKSQVPGLTHSRKIVRYFTWVMWTWVLHHNSRTVMQTRITWCWKTKCYPQHVWPCLLHRQGQSISPRPIRTQCGFRHHWHQLLLSVLANQFSTDSTAFSWFESYLTDGTQTFTHIQRWADIQFPSRL